MVKANNTMTQE
jgi:hypothetical protein